MITKRRTRNTIHYNLDDVAKLLGVCKRTINNYMYSDNLTLSDFNKSLDTLYSFIRKYKE